MNRWRPRWRTSPPRRPAARSGLEHVRIVEQFFDDLPSHIDRQTRDQAEADLARMANGSGADTVSGGRGPVGAAAQPGRRAAPMTPSTPGAGTSRWRSRASMG